MSKENQQVASKLIKISLLSLLFMTVEFVGGHLAHSIAIWSDAFHLLSDVLAYVISLVAVLLSERKSPEYLTFGWMKAQTLGALFNVIFIYIVTIELFIEATHRLIKQDKVEEPVYMLITSIFGLICNLIVLTILHSDPNGGHHGCSHQHHGAHLHQQDHSNHHHHDGKPCSGTHLPLADIPKSISQSSKGETENKHKHQNHSSCCSHQHHSSHTDHHQHDSPHSDEHQHHHQHLENGHKKSHSHQKEHSHGKNGCCSSKNNKSQQQGQRDSGDEIVDSANTIKKVHNLMESQLLPSIGSDQEIGIKTHNQGKTKNINLDAAYIHIITDIILSIGVIIAALIIYFFAPEGQQWSPWHIADPLCTYLFSFLAIYSTWPIFKESLLILLDGCEDPHLLEQIKAELLKTKEIKEIVDLKIWSLNRGKHQAAVKVKMAKDFGSWRVKKVFALRGIECFVEVVQEQMHLHE